MEESVISKVEANADNITANLNQTYCGDSFKNFNKLYKQYHGYIAVFICILGITFNTFNIIVLTRKKMKSSVNTILTALAICDITFLIVFCVYSINNFILIHYIPEEKYYVYERMVILLTLCEIWIVLHTMSIAFTITVAILRFIAVYFPFKASQLCSNYRTHVAIAISCIASILFCIPMFLQYTVKAKSSKYEFHLSDIATKNNNLLKTINFWLFGIVVKIIPCAMISVLSFALLRVLQKAKKLVLTNEKINKKANDKLTPMLLGILVLYVVTELPPGILFFVSAFLPEEFYQTCFQYLMELLDLLALLNKMLNFVIYYTMCHRFRMTFKQLFSKRSVGRESMMTSTVKEKLSSTRSISETTHM